jgi:hypothetical protein
MRGIFYAKGPNIHSEKIAPFKNVDIYPFILGILKIPSSNKIDGNPQTLMKFIR